MSTNIFITGLQQLQRRLQEAADANRRAALEREARDVRLQVFASTPTSPINEPVRPIRSLLKGAGPTAQREREKRRFGAPQGPGTICWFYLDRDPVAFSQDVITVVSEDATASVSTSLTARYEGFALTADSGPYASSYPFVFTPDGAWSDWDPEIDPSPEITTWTSQVSGTLEFPTVLPLAEVDKTFICSLPVSAKAQLLYLQEIAAVGVYHVLEQSTSVIARKQFEGPADGDLETMLADSGIPKTLSFAVTAFDTEPSVTEYTQSVDGAYGWHCGATAVASLSSGSADALAGSLVGVAEVGFAASTQAGVGSTNNVLNPKLLINDYEYDGLTFSAVTVYIAGAFQPAYVSLTSYPTLLGDHQDNIRILLETPYGSSNALYVENYEDDVFDISYVYAFGASSVLSGGVTGSPLAVTPVVYDLLENNITYDYDTAIAASLSQLFADTSPQPAGFSFNAVTYITDSTYFDPVNFYLTTDSTTLSWNRYSFTADNYDPDSLWPDGYPFVPPTSISSASFAIAPLAGRVGIEDELEGRLNYCYANAYDQSAACQAKLASWGVTLPPLF